MRAALEQARRAFERGEIPVGAVVVKEGDILARAHNLNRSHRNPLHHAEILAIEEACSCLSNERLTDCDLYVTKEPCAMCAGAIVHARFRRVIIAAEDRKYGACGTVMEICGSDKLNHRPEIHFGLLREEAASLLGDFFRKLRQR